MLNEQVLDILGILNILINYNVSALKKSSLGTCEQHSCSTCNIQKRVIPLTFVKNFLPKFFERIQFF